MRVAVWDLLPFEVFAAAETSRQDLSFVALPMERCRSALEGGIVDVALLPVLDLLREPAPFDVLPAVSVSSWSFPFAKIVLKHGLGSRLGTFAVPHGHDQMAFVARVVLHEHYQSEPTAIATGHLAPRALEGGDEDGYLVVGPAVPSYEPAFLTLDLGREWYELANYPMVWGLFATERGQGTPAVIRAVRDAIVRADSARPSSADRIPSSDSIKSFIRDDLRFRLDDLAVASLTELSNYVYYYGVTEDVRSVPFVSLPDDEDGDVGKQPLPTL